MRRAINRHGNDAASHIEIDPNRLDLAQNTNPAFIKYSEDCK